MKGIHRRPPKRGPIVARRGIALGLVMTLFTAGIALADNIIADGDGVAPTTSNSLDIGLVCPGSTTSKTVLLAVNRNGSATGTNTFASSATVTVTAPTVTGGFGVTMTDGSIVLPSNWPTLPNNTVSSGVDGIASASVTFVAGTTSGVVNGTAVFRASGGNTSGDVITRTIDPAMQLKVTVREANDSNCAPADTTKPVIASSVTGTAGNNGWYTTDVVVSWTVVDLESAISSSSGCGPTTVNADTAGTTFTCSATSAGGSNSQSVTIKRDATAPTITAAPAAVSGWNTSDVTVTFSCSDAVSGIASCSSPQAVSDEGADQALTGTATDLAGNTASATVSGINIDKSAPTIVGGALPAANEARWNNSSVTVSFVCGDTVSGVYTCSSASVFDSETTSLGQSVTGYATDYAGLTSSDTVGPIKIDLTAPTITGSVPVANSYGWYKANVPASFLCSDGLSGIASCGPNALVSDEGAGQSVGGTAIDNGGNSASDTVGGINLDKTPPTVDPTMVASPILLGGVGAVLAGASDGLSGIASVTCGTIDTSSVGPKSVSCTATDKAGNSKVGSVSYSVIYDSTGFFRPVDMGNTVNIVKAGSAIPVKFSLRGDQGLEIFATGYPRSIPVNCPNTANPDSIEETVTAGNSSLSYDASSDQYNYVWKTVKTWTGCRQLEVKFIDGTTKTALFKLTK